MNTDTQQPYKPMSTPTLESLKDEVRKAGYTPSAGSWEDSENICVFSTESVPGCYGHPRFEASYSRTTGWLRIGNKSSSTHAAL